MVNIEQLIDDAKCYDVVRDLRWSDGVRCPECNSADIKKRGWHDRYNYRQRYECKTCGQQFDDLSGTIFQGHHQALRVWVICLYFMGLNPDLLSQFSSAIDHQAGALSQVGHIAPSPPEGAPTRVSISFASLEPAQAGHQQPKGC